MILQEDPPLKNLLKRLGTAAWAIPSLLGILFIAPNFLWFGVGAFALAAAVWELTAITHDSADRSGRLAGVLFALLSFWLFVGTRFGAVHGAWLGIGMLGLVMAVLLFTLARPKHLPNVLPQLCGYLLASFYLGGMMACLVLVRGFGTTRDGGFLVVLALSFAWVSDTCAMAAGKLIGGPKLYPAVSPKKTWIGAFAGLLGSLLAFLIVRSFFLQTFPFWSGVTLAFVAGVLGQFGDLAESLLKRAKGIKDSGAALAGHGGFLDRLDAVLFSAVVTFAALQLGLLPFSPR